LTNCKFKYF